MALLPSTVSSNWGQNILGDLSGHVNIFCDCQTFPYQEPGFAPQNEGQGLE